MSSLFSGYDKRFSYSIAHYDITLVPNPANAKFSGSIGGSDTPAAHQGNLFFAGRKVQWTA